MATKHKHSKARQWFRRLLATVTGGYLAVCGGMYCAQDRLLFHPTSDASPQAAGSDATLQLLPLSFEVEGALLRGTLVPGAGPLPRPTVLYFGGNAERVAQHVTTRGWIQALGWNQVYVSYRGYDQSTGTPSARDLLNDAVAIYDSLTTRPDVAPQRVALWGYSLGSGLAAHVASQRPAAGVILAAPYTRLADIAADAYPWLPVRPLFRHNIDTITAAASITAPALLLHGDADQLITPEHSLRIQQAWAGTARFVSVPNSGHNGLGSHPVVRKAVTQFLRELE